MNDTNFVNRIQKVMEYYAISASKFADALGIGRSSVSHILSGRNKPSLDFVMKITDAFPECDLYWLLYNKGSFPRSKSDDNAFKSLKSATIKQNKEETPHVIQKSLFDDNNDAVPNQVVSKDVAREIPKNVIAKSKDSLLIERVIIFYKDGTFEQFIQKNK